MGKGAKGEIRVCQHCKKEFIDKVGNKKFCSDLCRRKYWKYEKVKLQCPDCGAIYPIKKYKKIEGGYRNGKEEG